MLDLEELRTRLRNMSDNELEGYGGGAKIMCSFAVNARTLPRECFVVQLRESQVEWIRRKSVEFRVVLVGLKIAICKDIFDSFRVPHPNDVPSLRFSSSASSLLQRTIINFRYFSDF